MIYGIKDKLPFPKLLLFAIQMVLSVFVATVLIANICGVSVSGALVGAGLATIVYAFMTRGDSPMFVSNSGAFVTPVLTALALGGYTAVAIGGLTTAIIYCLFGAIFAKIPVNKIYTVFPRSLIGAITAVIGINLMGFIPTYVLVNGAVSMWGISVALVTLFTIILVSHYAKGVLRILPFIVGTLVGYGYAAFLTHIGVCALIDFSVFANMSLLNMPNFAFTHWTAIPFATIVSVVLLYAAYTVSAICECLSDHAALGGIIGTDLYEKPGLSRIFIGEGLANIVGSFVGGLGICSYGESVACIGFSRVGATRVTITAAIMLMLLGCLAPVQIFIASIPSCVFAGAAMILYGYIACSGIKMLQQVDLTVQKDLIITSVVLSLGVCGITVGTGALAFSGTALALIVGIILNFVIKN